MCGGLKTSLFLTYCEQLLPEDKTSWSFLQEISKCLCLERQVAGTHSKARKCLKNRRIQGFSFTEISGSLGLHHRRGGEWGPRVNRLPTAALPVTFGGLTHQTAQTAAGMRGQWFSLGFFVHKVGIVIEPALRGCFQGSVDTVSVICFDSFWSLWKGIGCNLIM